MATLTANELLHYFHQHGLIADLALAEIAPLNGGVSSAIHLVKSSRGIFVVKQALETLRVREEWICDPMRNLYEQDFMAVAESVLPGSVPRLLHCDRKRGLFAMEYLDRPWVNWKSLLMAGDLSPAIATRVGCRLGELHRAGWEREDLARKFDNTRLFHELRIAPYLLVTAAKHPELASHFEAEAQRLAHTRLTLVHGDYSPKNLMTDGIAIKILDAEVAWFGDPAFDVAFLLNHLLLKAVRFPARFDVYAVLRSAFLRAYRTALGEHWGDEIDLRSSRLVILLMMARISGKSPVEYFSSGGAEACAIVEFTKSLLSAGTVLPNLAALDLQFCQAFSHEN